MSTAARVKDLCEVPALFPELAATRAPKKERNHAAPAMAPFVIVRAIGESTSKPKIDCPEVAANLWRNEIATRPDYEPEKESLWVILLDTKYSLKALHRVSLGSLNESVAHPREIFRAPIACGAYAFVLMHNHPSGDPSPSDADRRVTIRLNECAKMLQINFFDHVIVGDAARHFSFREAGII